ncbi:uncharacterized protein LOC144612368 [Rhinoraja longicauda]
MGGRGRAQMTFSVEVVGIGRGEVLPHPPCNPLPSIRTSEMSSAHKLEAFRQPIGHNPVGVLKVNLVAIVILSRGKCGLSTCTTRYLVAMAAADLLTLITGVILFRLRYHFFPWSILSITPVCSVFDVLKSAATDCSVWFTVTFTFDRFVARS